MTIITKADLARELKVSKPRVSQYVARGLPVLPDGKVDREAALNWLSINTIGTGDDKGCSRAAFLARAKPPVAAKPNWYTNFLRNLLDEIDDPFDRGAVFAVMVLNQGIGLLAACLAVGAGAPLKVAYALESAVSVGFMDDCADMLSKAGVEPFATDREAGVWPSPERLLQPNWADLAAEVGEPVDLEAWKAWLAHCFGGGAEDAPEAEASLNKSVK